MEQGVGCREDAKRSEDAVRRLADSISEGVALVREGRIVWANEALAAMAARPSAAELAGAELASLVADLGEGVPGASGEGRPLASPRALECGLRRPDGSLRRVVWRLAWAGIDAGADVFVVEDPTPVRELGLEVLRAGRELGRLHREVEGLRHRLHHERVARDEMLAVVSHELRTPVTVIGGYSRILLREDAGPLTPEQRRFLEESSRACRKLDAFIERLIAASPVALGGEVLEVGSSPLAPLLADVAERMRGLFEERRSRIAVEVAPGCRARFDPVRIEQVLTNLLDNALKYAAPEVSVEISARPVEVDARPMVEVVVADDGPGIPPDERERVFQAYVRGRRSCASGLGLGLALCKRIVEGHGGRITLDERPGGGCRFAFTLPRAEA
jgi:signal transduction histidine kinase